MERTTNTADRTITFLVCIGFICFLNGNKYARKAIRVAIAAGMTENRDHTIVRTESVTEAGSMVVLPIGSVIIFAPARPRKRAIREPEIAVPSFWAIVPDEKINPVEEAPKVSVA